MTIRFEENSSRIINYEFCCNSMQKNINKTIKLNRHPNGGIHTAYIQVNSLDLLINNCPFCGVEINIT